MKKNILFVSLFYIVSNLFAQVGVGTTDVEPSAVLELKSTTKGFLMPRMTTAERNAITTPEEGLMVYNTDRSAMQFYRKNIGTSGTLEGWYDSKCNSDIAAAIASLPGGLTLDFSDLSQNGQFFPNTNGGGTAFTASTPDGTSFNSIGPIPLDITQPLSVSNETYISLVDNSEGNVYDFKNLSVPNDYNAATFANRNTNSSGTNSSNGMIADLTDYTGDFDVIVVAKFNVISTNNNASFFGTGNSLGALIGAGSNSQAICKRDFFNLKVRTKSDLCGGANKVPVDLNFHRFRIKYTANNGGTNAIVEVSIDGNVLTTFQGSSINNAGLENISLFSNRSLDSHAASSIAFLGVYTNHLTDANFEALDKYLACKFE